jgi:integrase
LQLESLNWRAGTIRFEAAKAGRQLELPLTNRVGSAIVDYLRRGRPRTSTRALFVSTDPPFGPLQAHSFYNIVARAFQIAATVPMIILAHGVVEVAVIMHGRFLGVQNGQARARRRHDSLRMSQHFKVEDGHVVRGHDTPA